MNSLNLNFDNVTALGICSQFGLACQDWKPTLVGTVHSFGNMLGLLLQGQISDRSHIHDSSHFAINLQPYSTFCYKYSSSLYLRPFRHSFTAATCSFISADTNNHVDDIHDQYCRIIECCIRHTCMMCFLELEPLA